MKKSDMRFARQEAIKRHLWMIDYPWQITKDNLRLCVRLYERQFYGFELKAYA